MDPNLLAPGAVPGMPPEAVRLHPIGFPHPTQLAVPVFLWDLTFAVIMRLEKFPAGFWLPEPREVREEGWIPAWGSC